jgi:hypothetical protein
MTSKNQKLTQPADIEHLATNSDLLEWSNYPAIIAHWQRFISSERLFVLFMEDIANRPGDILVDICSYLGIEPHDAMLRNADNAIHVGATQDIPPSIMSLLKEQLRPIYREFAKLYPEIGERWMLRYGL